MWSACDKPARDFLWGLAAPNARKILRAPPVGPIVSLHASKQQQGYWPNFCALRGPQTPRPTPPQKLALTPRPFREPASTASLRSRCDQGRALRAAIKPGRWMGWERWTLENHPRDHYNFGSSKESANDMQPLPN